MTAPSMQKPSSTIAWFRLAEFVDRREKERALGMYRLLAHSVQDKAVATQLQGDLLKAFDDERALSTYEEAATMFARSDRIEQAVLLYEQAIAYALTLKKYAHIKSFVAKNYLSTTERTALCMRCVIEILMYHQHERVEHDCSTCLSWACDQIIAEPVLNTSFMAKVQALDPELHIHVQTQHIGKHH